MQKFDKTSDLSKKYFQVTAKNIKRKKSSWETPLNVPHGNINLFRGRVGQTQLRTTGPELGLRRDRIAGS